MAVVGAAALACWPLGLFVPIQDIDEALYAYVGRTPWTGHYDLIGGLVGIGVYALERLPRPPAGAMLARVIDRLDELAEHNALGITWFTSPELLPDQQRTHYPTGYYNLGLAHGVPGVIGLLARAYAVGVAPGKVGRLLSGAVAWSLAQQITPDGEGAGGFPAWVAPGQTAPVARLAWCYGDPGVAVTLLAAARAAHVPAWEQAALAIARRAVHHARENSGVKDSCLCHGAAGLGHLFNRHYQATGDPQLGEAARGWFAQALTLRQPNVGIAGFCHWGTTASGALGWVDDPSLLNGAAGIALALLAATTPIEPAWDRLLLLG